MVNISYKTCNLCEAMCGLVIEHDDKSIISMKGNKDDVFSKSHICPKALALGDIHFDPDRLILPQKRTGDKWQTISWEEAFSEVTEKIHQIQSKYGNDSVATYFGNPYAHNYGAFLLAPTFL